MLSEFLFQNPPWIILLVQGSACLAIGLAASYILNQRAARAHHALWIATLVAVSMPTTYWLVDHFELGVLSPEIVIEEPLEDNIPATISGVDLPTLSATNIPVDPMVIDESEILAEPTQAPVTTPITLPWRTIGWTCWLVITTLLLGRLLLRFVLGMRLVRHSFPVKKSLLHKALKTAKRKNNINATVALRQNHHVRSPIIWCWSSQPILLVHDTTKHNGDTIDWTGIFCHELAHWKRRDHLTGLFAELLTALLPWHPLLWWVRRRLMALSEAVCDDWVVASGQTGVDYAESLLNLSPQKQLAFLPTVVGKERAMKERIHRIVKDRCSNPKIGTAWTLAIVSLAILVTAGTALAQRRPFEKPQAKQREMMEIRRTILHQELEQQVDQARDLEAALRKQGDEPSLKRQELEVRLELKHQIIQAMERQLANLERPEPRQREERSEIDARFEELGRRQDELREHAGNLERELKEIGDRRPEARERMEMELREIHENLERLERERVEIDRAQGRARRREGRPEIDAQMEELNRRQDELREHAGNLERKLQELGDRRPEARERMKMELREVQENLERLEMERTELDRQRPRGREAGQRQMNPEVRELTGHLRELRQHGRERQEELERLDDKDSEHALDLRRAIDETREEIRNVENRLREVGAPMREGRVSRKRSEDEDSIRALEGLQAQIRMTQEKLHEAKEANRHDAVQKLRNVLEQLHERQEAMESRTPEPDRLRPAREEIEGQVEELRQKVDGMHEQMQEMREMLHELLKRRETVERQVEVEVHR